MGLEKGRFPEISRVYGKRIWRCCTMRSRTCGSDRAREQGVFWVQEGGVKGGNRVFTVSCVVLLRSTKDKEYFMCET